MKIIVISALIFVSFAASCLASVSDTAWTVTLPENEYVVFAHFSSDDSLISIIVYYTNDKEYDPDSTYTSVRNSYTGEEIRRTVSYKSDPNKFVTGYIKPFTDTAYNFKYTNSTTAPYFYIFRMNDITGQIIDSIPVNVDIPEFKNDTNFVSYSAISPDGKRYIIVLSIISGYEPNGVYIYEQKLFVWNTENWTIDRSFYFNNGILLRISTNNKYYYSYLTKQNAYSFDDINNDSTLCKLVDNDSVSYGIIRFPKKDTSKFLIQIYDKIDHRNKIQVRSQTDFSIIKTIVNDTLRNITKINYSNDSQYLICQGDNLSILAGYNFIYDLLNERIVYIYPEKYYHWLGEYGASFLVVSNNSELIFDGGKRQNYMLNAKYTTTSTKEPDKESPGLIFPNPAEDYIEINVPRWRGQGVDGFSPSEKRGEHHSAMFTGGVSIFNVLGMEVTTPSLRDTPPYQGGEIVRIDVSSLVPGVYFVRVGDVVRKFVKM